jgi:hypothetical protein
MMKKIYLLIVSTFLILPSFNSVSASNNKTENKVKARCFVSLYGGQQTIVYQIINEKRFKNLSTSLTNKTVMTTLSENKQKIYEVIECVKNDDPFTDNNALAVEKVTAK